MATMYKYDEEIAQNFLTLQIPSCAYVCMYICNDDCNQSNYVRLCEKCGNSYCLDCNQSGGKEHAYMQQVQPKPEELNGECPECSGEIYRFIYFNTYEDDRYLLRMVVEKGSLDKDVSDPMSHVYLVHKDKEPVKEG